MLHHINEHHAIGKFQRSFDRIGQTACNAVFQHNSVNDNFNIMLLVFFQRNFFLQLTHFAIYTYTHIAAFFQLFKRFLIFTFFTSGNRRHHLYFGTLRISKHLVYHLLYSLLCDWFAAFWAMRCPHTSKQQTQIVINFCYRPYSRTGIAAGGFLVNGYCRRQPFNIIYVRLIHLPQKHTGIAG